ncbi:uncharacterized protein LOC144321940 isoform X2 [Canis aureus]
MKIKYTSNFMSTMCIIVKHSRWRIYYTFWQRILNQEPTRISKAAKRNIITQCLVVSCLQTMMGSPLSTALSTPGVYRMYAWNQKEKSYDRREGEREREKENLKQTSCPAWSLMGARSHNPEIMT